MSQPTETLGLKMFHLWHGREQRSDWYLHRDRGRNRFNAATAPYADAPPRLLGIDHLARPARLLCCCPAAADWTLFVPLRLEGFELQPVFGDDAQALAGLPSRLRNSDIDGVAVLALGGTEVFAGVPALAQQFGKRLITLTQENVARVLDLRGQKAVAEFRWDGRVHVLDRLGRTHPFDWQSYAAARIAPRRTPEAFLRALRRGGQRAHNLGRRALRRLLGRTS